MSSPSSPRSNLGVISSNIEISPPQRSTLASAARRIPSYLGDITIMVDSNNSTRFPGWYTDPRSPDMERFWDGRTWTDSTRDAETASAARADVVVDLTTVPGIVSTKPADDIAPPAPTTAFFEADNGAGLFSQPAGAPERASAAGQGDAKAAASPSALTGLFGKPDPSAAAAPKVEQPTARSSATAPSATAPAPTAPSESASRETVKKPDLSPTSDVTKEQLESAKAQLEKEPVAAEPAPSMVDLLKPKEGAEPSAPGTTRKAKPAQGANASSGSQLSEVTKAQARKTATSFPNSIAQPRPAEPKSSGTAAKTTGPASTPRTAKPKTSASQRVGSPTKAPTSTSIDHDPKTPWTAWAVIAGLCLAGGGFLLGLWAGSGDSEGSAGVEVTTTADAVTTTVATTEVVETTTDPAAEEAVAAAETRVEELEAESAANAEQLTSLEAEVETLQAERDNEAEHNELLQSWFTADVLARSQGNWDFEVSRACALETEPTLDDLNYSRRLEVIGTPADLLAAVQDCRG